MYDESPIVDLNFLREHMIELDRAREKGPMCQMEKANVGSEVIAAVVTRNRILPYQAPCSPLKVNLRFGETCHILV
jgi:hypothetical protein